MTTARDSPRVIRATLNSEKVPLSSSKRGTGVRSTPDPPILDAWDASFGH